MVVWFTSASCDASGMLITVPMVAAMMAAIKVSFKVVPFRLW